jgi:tetratricopeptide (TPR) repeat protein
LRRELLYIEVMSQSDNSSERIPPIRPRRRLRRALLASAVTLSAAILFTVINRKPSPAQRPANQQQAISQVQTLDEKGSRSGRTHDYVRALGCYRAALEISREFDLKESSVAALLDLGDIFEERARRDRYRLGRDTADLDSAETYYRKGLGMSRESNYPSGEAEVLVSLGMLYARSRREFKNGEILMSQALRILGEAPDTQAAAPLFYNRGLIRGRRGDFAGALEDFQVALPAYQALGDGPAVKLTEYHVAKLDSLLAQQGALAPNDTLWDRVPIRMAHGLRLTVNGPNSGR